MEQLRPSNGGVSLSFSSLFQLEQQLLHAVSQLPKVKVDELRITMGRSARGIYLRFDVLPLDEKDLNNKGVSVGRQACVSNGMFLVPAEDVCRDQVYRTGVRRRGTREEVDRHPDGRVDKKEQVKLSEHVSSPFRFDIL